MCACDLPLVRLENRSGWHAAVSEQYTSYETMLQDGHSISNDSNQFLHSSVTQVYAGYDFSPAVGVQLNVPLIYRSFRRVENGAVQSGAESGLGDISLLAHWMPLQIATPDVRVTGRLYAGVKLPTGDSSRVAEEGNESHDHGESNAGAEEHEHEHEEPSGVHGHDLALGTGSIDGIFGAELYAQWKRVFVEGSVQVAARGQGHHQYDFADDTAWHAGLGAIVWEGNDFNIGLEARFSGETKGEDKFRGEVSDDTAATNIYLGPRIVATWAGRLGAELGVEFPISRDNSGVQIAPDVRVQASVGWQF